MECEVKNYDDEEGLNRKIYNVTLIGTTNDTLEVKIHFEEPHDITVDMLDPDVLLIKIMMPELIIDAETGQNFKADEGFLQFNIPLMPQITDEDLKALEDMK